MYFDIYHNIFYAMKIITLVDFSIYYIKEYIVITLISIIAAKAESNTA